MNYVSRRKGMSMFTIDFNLGFIPLNWDGFRWVINQVIQKIVKNIGNRTIVLFSCVIQEITNLFWSSPKSSVKWFKQSQFSDL